MKIDCTTALFFDASCLIAAAGTPTGGSGFLLSLCARKLLCAVVSLAVLLEAERNIQEKRGQIVLSAFHALVLSTPFQVAPVPVVPKTTGWLHFVNAKDAHVVASVLSRKTPFLLTLDQNLIAEIGRANLPFAALTQEGSSLRCWCNMQTTA